MRRVFGVLFEYTHTLCFSQTRSSRSTLFRTTHVVFPAVINSRVQNTSVYHVPRNWLYTRPHANNDRASEKKR